jgi:HK97 family phage portal protein
VIFSRIFAGVDLPATRPAADDDYWYQPIGAPVSSGVSMTPDSVLRASPMWDGITMIARDVGSLPCQMFRWRADGGKERAALHPIADVLRYTPNAWQTAIEYWQTVMGHALMRGNHYSVIVPGRRGFVDQLIPLHPDRVTPRIELVWQQLGDSVRQFPVPKFWYVYRAVDSGQDTVFSSDEVFHVRGFSIDGLVGVSLITYARESIGLTLASEQYGARFFGQGGKPPGALRHPTKLTPEAARKLKLQWEQAHGGLGNAHRVVVLEEGIEWINMGTTDKDAQFLETRQFQIEEAARWLNVPVSRLQRMGTQTYASAYMYELDYWMSSIRPWCVTIEQAIRRDLIDADRTYFAEFLMDAVLRGDPNSRSQVYGSAIQNGWMTRNEVRGKENLNPLPGLDTPLEPRNMAPAGTQQARTMAVVQEQAARIVRKELGAIETAVQRHGADTPACQQELSAFYVGQRAFVASVLHIDPIVAGAYCDGQQDVIETEGVGAAREWAATVPPILMDLALGGDVHV